MMMGDLGRVEQGSTREDDGAGGLELSLGLAIGGRSSYAGTTAPAEARTVVAATLGRTVSGPPDVLEVQRRREMHAIKRQEARRKLEEKQIRKGGAAGAVARGKNNSGGAGLGLLRSCSAEDRSAMEVQGHRARARDREGREVDDDARDHRKGVGSRSPPLEVAARCGSTPTASKSRSGSTTPSEIALENNNNNNTATTNNASNPIHNTTTVAPYPFPPVMPMPYPIHPAQYVHLGAGAAAAGFGFPYVVPCWNPQVGPAGGEEGNHRGHLPPPQQPVPAALPQGRGSSFRPFRLASGNVGGVFPTTSGDMKGAEVVSPPAKARSTDNGGGGMKRVSSLSAISECRSHPHPAPGCGGPGDSSGSRGGDNNAQSNSSPEQQAAVTPGRPSTSLSMDPSPAQSDHSVSSNPAAKDTPQRPSPVSFPLPTDKKCGQNERPLDAPVSRSCDDRVSSPSHAAVNHQPLPRPASAAVTPTNRPARPRRMPYVSAKGTGPNGRTVTGFLYKFDDKDKVSIVCVCHGSCFTPAEFVRHAGATDVDNPLRHIVMVEEPAEHRIMVPSA